MNVPEEDIKLRETQNKGNQDKKNQETKMYNKAKSLLSKAKKDMTMWGQNNVVSYAKLLTANGTGRKPIEM